MLCVDEEGHRVCTMYNLVKLGSKSIKIRTIVAQKYGQLSVSRTHRFSQLSVAAAAAAADNCLSSCPIVYLQG